MTNRALHPPTPPREVWFVAVVVTVVTVTLATYTAVSSHQWVGRVFPGFLMLGNRVVASVGLSTWSSTKVPGVHWWQVTAVEGAQATSSIAVYARAAQGDANSLRYRLRRRGEEREVTMATQRFGESDWLFFFLPFLINGVVTIACGLSVWVMGPTRPVSRAFLALGGITGVFFLSAPDLYLPGPFSALARVCEAMLTGGVVQLALLFPQASRWARWRFAGYVAAAPFALLKVVWFDDADAYVYLVRASYVVTGAAVVLLLARVVSAYRQASTPMVRQRARLVSVGTGLGIVLPGLVLAITVLTSGQMATNVAAFMPFLFAVSVSYAIVQQDLFEIDAMVKRGAYYLVLSAVVAATYLAAVLLFHQLLRAGIVSNSPVFPVAFTLTVLLLFNPLRARLQAFVDRVFFGARYDGTQAVALASERLASALTRDEIVRIVRDSVESAIRNGATQLVEDIPPALVQPLAAGRVVTSADPPERYVSVQQHQDVRSAMAALHAQIAVPMQRAGALIGALTAGAKSSGVFYTAADAEFLRAIAQSAAIALQNARSYEALTNLNRGLEERVRERTAQLAQAEKMASLGRLVAGVAHEINNPVTFVANSVPPLRRRLQEIGAAAAPELQAKISEAAELVDIMADGAARTAAIVKDLRSFARADEAVHKAVDLHEVIDVTLRLLQPRWRDRIAIHREYGRLQPVPCDPGQIGQVFMNVLANACDAIAAHGNIWVTSEQSNGSVRVCVRDDGCGMSPEVQQHIFDPFFTTRDVGQGTGLGLALTHGIIRAHGGSIVVSSSPGEGSSFTVILPAVPARSL